MRTRSLILGMLLSLLIGPAAAAGPAADFFVAPNGNDRWSGTLAAPNSAQTDGPFATLARAQQAVRQLKQAQPGRTRPITVLVRAGTYYLAEPLTFTPEDSGTAEAPILYAAYPGEQPVISGGTPITGWRADGKRWQTTLPQVAQGEWNFVQLFVNGERRYRPRLPKQGYYTIASDAPPTPRAGGKGFDTFHFTPGEIRADWHNLGDVDVLCFQIWTMARMRIASVDEQDALVTFTGRTRSATRWSALDKGKRFIVENVREALSEPGEWYLDRADGTLTYLPQPGETPDTTTVIAPRLEQLVMLKGDVAGRQWVQHLTFRGLTFAHANWVNPAEGNNYSQAEVNLSAAILAEGARDCALEGCTVAHSGAYAVEWGQGCRRNRVEDCVLTDLGGGGVKVGTMKAPEDEEAVAGWQIIRNNLITGGGRLHPAAVGVWIGQSPFNTVTHNDILDLYYSGVSAGWTWGYGTSLAHHNLIADNRIANIGQGILSDMGGIYTLGVSPGTVLRGNLIHDVYATTYGGWGIYFDEGSTGILAEKNVVYRTKDGGFHQHYGRENQVVNNVFAMARECQIRRTRAEAHLSFTFQRNIVYWEGGALLSGNWSDSQYKLDNNLYWQAKGEPLQFATMSLEEWRQGGQDQHSLVADPLFVNAAKDDFRLQPGSPAEKIGFQPIDISPAGREPGHLTAIPAVPRAFPPVTAN